MEQYILTFETPAQEERFLRLAKDAPGPVAAKGAVGPHQDSRHPVGLPGSGPDRQVCPARGFPKGRGPHPRRIRQRRT